MIGFPHYADAEEAKSIGGMLALWPRSDYAEMLAIDGGEPQDDLHLTLVYLGDDVTGSDPGTLGDALQQISGSYTAIDATIFGHAIFNPDTEDPAGVYLLSDSPELDQLHDEVLEAAQIGYPDLPPQHVPWCPHVTCSWGSPATVGQYTGPVVFDRLGLSFAGQTEFFPLLGVGINASRGPLPHWPLR